MRNYVKPIVEETLVLTNDVLATSGIEINNTNAGFNNPDETL